MPEHRAERLDGEPEFRPVDLTEMQVAGVLMAANERFFWPLGLALTWIHETGDELSGEATQLHIRQWNYPDGHIEAIEVAEDDAVAIERRARFSEWLNARLGRFKIKDEAEAARRTGEEIRRAE